MLGKARRRRSVHKHTASKALLALYSAALLLISSCSHVPGVSADGGFSDAGNRAVHELSAAMTPTNTYAVIVSGSRYWFNYRHSANALAVYTLLRRAGVPDDRIILMLAEDHSSKLNNRYLGSVYLAEREAPVSAVPAWLRGSGNASRLSSDAASWLDDTEEEDASGRAPVHVATNSGGSTSLEQLIAAHAAEAAAAAAVATAHIPASERSRLSVLPQQDCEVDFTAGDVTAGALLGVITGRHRHGTPVQQRFSGLPTRRAAAPVGAIALDAGGTSSSGTSTGSSSGPGGSQSAGPHLLLYMTGHGGDGFLKLSDKEEVAAPDLGAAIASALRSGRFGSATALFDTCQAATLHESWWTPGGIAFSSSVRGQNSYAYGVDSAGAGVGQALSDGFTRLLWDHLAATSAASGPMTAAAAASAAASAAAAAAAHPSGPPRSAVLVNATSDGAAEAQQQAQVAAVEAAPQAEAEVPLSLADALGIALKRRGAAKAVRARLTGAAAARANAGAPAAPAVSSISTLASATAAAAATGSGMTTSARFDGGLSDALAAIAPWRIGSTVTAHATASAPLQLLARLARELQPLTLQHSTSADGASSAATAMHLAAVVRLPLQQLRRSRSVAGASIAAAAGDVLRWLGVPAESALSAEESLLAAARAVLPTASSSSSGQAAHNLAISVVEACLPLMRVWQADGVIVAEPGRHKQDTDDVLRLVQSLLSCDATGAGGQSWPAAAPVLAISAQQLSACRDGRAALARCTAAVLEPSVTAAARAAQAAEHAAAQRRLLAAHGIGGDREEVKAGVADAASAPALARRPRSRGAAPVPPFTDALLQHLPLDGVFADLDTGRPRSA